MFKLAVKLVIGMANTIAQIRLSYPTYTKFAMHSLRYEVSQQREQHKHTENILNKIF